VSLALILPRLGVPAIEGMAWGTLVGGALQLLAQTPQLRRVGFRLQAVFDWREPGVRQIFRLMLPAVVGLSATQINVFINTFYASSCGQGSVSWLNYAYRLVHLPQGLFGVALSVATLPMVSRFAAHENLPAMKEAFKSSLAMAMILTIPAAAGLMALSRPICAVIFQHGRFSAFDTQQTAAALVLYCLGLFAFAGVKILVPVFYTLNDTKIPVMGSFITVAANIILINLIIAPLGHLAIALSTSLSMVVNLLFLGVTLYRKVEGYAVGDLLATLAKVTGASAVMGLTVWGAYSLTIHGLGGGLPREILALAGSICLGVALYLALIAPLKIPEFQSLFTALKSRLGRRKSG
jgi:putative peptidoglycan lipid II flippase